MFLLLPNAVRQGQENTFSLGIFDELLKSVEKRLDSAEKIPEIEKLIDEAVDETEAQSFAVLASGKGVGSAISTGVYAAIVLLLIAKMNGAYDFKSGEGHIGLSPGVPAGVTEFVEGVGKAISGILNAEAPRLEPPSGQSGILPPPEPGSGRALTMPSGKVLQRVVPGYLSDRDRALELKNKIAEILDENDICILAGVKAGRAGLFGKSYGFSSAWTYPFPIMAGVGMRQESPILGGGSERYRLAIRLQSAFELRPNILRQIQAWFDEQCRDLFSVRWTSKVVTLGSNPNGVLGTWKGAKALRNGPASGAALNVGGGAVGATTILVTKGEKIHLLTAGHVV